MKTLFVVTLLMAACSVTVVAAPVTSEKVRDMVAGWRILSDNPLGTSLSKQITTIDPVHDTNAVLLYYVVHLEPEGYILTAPDDDIEPVIAFSAHAKYERHVGNPLTTLIENDMRGRLLLVASARMRTSSLTTNTTDRHAKWKWFTDAGHDTQVKRANGLDVIDDVRVPPLLQTRWNQSAVGWPGEACYNYYSPPYEAGNSKNYYSGCTQTAWGQIIHHLGDIGVVAFHERHNVHWNKS